MIQHIIILPIINQLFIAVLLMFFYGRAKAQRTISVLGSVLNLVIAATLLQRVMSGGILSMQAGNWEAPFGITLVADHLAAVLVLLTAISGFAVSLFSVRTIHVKRVNFGYFPIFHFLLAGLNGAFLTGDIFNLYVWFEIMIISSFVLITLGGRKAQLEGAVKYFTLNILASVIFLTAIGILYGITGTLNMADLALKVPAVDNRGLVHVTGILFFIGFGIKSAVFPLYFWLPASYHTPPAAVSAIFGGLLTKVGVYALIRVFTLIFTDDLFLQRMLLGVAVLTIISGAMGALIKNDIRKIFSYFIICHIGFMVGGLGMMTKTAVAGAVFYLIHDIVVKTNLFMVAGMVKKITGKQDTRLLGGLYSTHPLLSLLMLVPLFSLVGVPPLSGFWPKILLFESALNQGYYFTFGAILFGSFITLFVVAKIWKRVFWGKPVEAVSPGFTLFDDETSAAEFKFILPVVLLSAVSLYIGFGAEHIGNLSQTIAGELTNPQAYIQAVFGELNLQLYED